MSPAAVLVDCDGMVVWDLFGYDVSRDADSGQGGP